MRKGSKGFFRKTSSPIKKTLMIPRVAMTCGIRSAWRRRLARTASAEKTESSSTQNRRLPSSPPQNAVILKNSGIVASLVCWTYWIE